MSSETAARIAKVTIETGDEERTIRLAAEAGTPQRVKVEFATGKTVVVNADGGFTFTAGDGRTVTVNADGEVEAEGRRSPLSSRMGPVNVSGSRGVQIGPGGFQANVF